MSTPAILALNVGQVAALQRAFVRSSRSLGGLVAHVTISERHVDTLDIADHPVERGAMISDHAYKLPVEVTITCGWSNSPATQQFLTLTSTPVTMSVQQVYEKLLKMQNDLELVDVITGKRAYTNMLLKQLETETNRDTENALLVTATFRELILTGTQVVSLGAAADASQQQSPELTAPVLNAGSKQLLPAPLYNPQAGP